MADRQLPGGPGGSVVRTPRLVLTVSGLLGAGLAWTTVSAMQSFGQSVPPVPLLAAGMLAVVAALVGFAAFLTHRHLHVRGARMEPTRAVTLLVLGKTSLLSGVGLAAAYLTVAALNLPDLAAALPQERVLGAGLAGLASGGLAVAGWFLEGACVVPKPPESDTSGSSPGGPEPA